MTYTHLSTNELVMIEAYYQIGKKVIDIAKALNRSRQTIYRVIAMLKKGYSAYEYYEQYKKNKRYCGRGKTQLSKKERALIQAHLDKGWNFDVIKGVYHKKISCSMRTLYRLVERGVFKKEDLPWKGKRRANGRKETRGKQAFVRDIHERAKYYPAFKEEFGHLEGDTIVGKNHQSAVITLVERKSKAIITLQTDGRKAQDIQKAISRWMSSFSTLPHLFKSITFDRGKEFSDWKTIANAHDIDIFFADPGCPSQRGLNEHSNGLLRRHGLPKQTDFIGMTQSYLSSIANKINMIPRKSLGYKTPYHVFLIYLKEALKKAMSKNV
ncbi:IS30 family transposase [Pelistega ratti]|uniref:IS30 family transposase n=1 Tax=Pelistega ratti TaxID=2652177 RepID=UPI00135AB5CC|nr:IS30 family transposase [Pelistega ratti]